MVVALSDEEEARSGLGEFGEDRELVGALSRATEKRVMTPGQQTLMCTLKP